MNKRLIFAIDDEPELLDHYKAFLSDQYEVLTFESPKELIQVVESGKLPDLFITDIKMNFMSGIQLLEWIRSKKIDRPFIIISGHSEKSDAIQALKLGAVDLIEKPFSGEVLVRVVRYAMTRSTYTLLQSELLNRYRVLNQTLTDLAKNYEERSHQAEEELLRVRHLEAGSFSGSDSGKKNNESVILEKVVSVTQDYIKELTALEAEIKRSIDLGE